MVVRHLLSFVFVLACQCCGTQLIAQTPATADSSTVERADIVLSNGIIHPGDGSDSVVGHVAIRDGKIISMGPESSPEADIRIDWRLRRPQAA